MAFQVPLIVFTKGTEEMSHVPLEREHSTRVKR
jgi:hypothetical protein